MIVNQYPGKLSLAGGGLGKPVCATPPCKKTPTMSNLRPGIHVSLIPHRYFQLTHQVFARGRNAVAHRAQLGATDLRMDRDLFELFFI
jgi:hypothetical protein